MEAPKLCCLLVFSSMCAIEMVSMQLTLSDYCEESVTENIKGHFVNTAIMEAAHPTYTCSKHAHACSLHRHTPCTGTCPHMHTHTRTHHTHTHN